MRDVATSMRRAIEDSHSFVPTPNTGVTWATTDGPAYTYTASHLLAGAGAVRS